MSNIPRRNLASGCHLLKKIDQPSWRTTRRNYKHIPQIVCISSRVPRAAPSSNGNLSNPKSSEDTLLYLYVIWNMLKSADLHENILKPVICHKNVRYYDGVTLYFSMKFHRSLQRRREMDIFHICEQTSAFWSKINQNKKQTTKKKRENLDWTLVNTENLRV